MRLDRDFEPGSLTWPSILVMGWMTSCSSVFASVHTGPGQRWALEYLVAVRCSPLFHAQLLVGT